MSFGFSITDFKEVIKLSWDLYKALKDGPEDIRNIARDLTIVYGVLNHIEDDLQSKDSAIKAHGEGRMKMLQSMTANLKATLDQVQKLVDKFRPMASGAKVTEQLWIKVKWVAGQRKIKRLHQDISFHISSFNLLMTSMGNSSLQRIETGLEEMRTMAEETSKAGPTHVGNLDGEPILETPEIDMDDDPLSTVESERKLAEAQRPPASPPTATENHDNRLSTQWLTPVVSLASDEFVERIQALPDHVHLELANVIFSNCRLACFEFYYSNGLWRTKYAHDDPPNERKLFQLDDGGFPRSPEDLELRDWLAKILRVYGRINQPDGVHVQSIRNYAESHQIFSNVTAIPALLNVFGKIDPDLLEDRLVVAFFFCEHLSAWNAAGHLKALWKEMHSPTFETRIREDGILWQLKPPISIHNVRVKISREGRRQT